MLKMEENGGFIIEFWSLINFDKENFVWWNRIVVGMIEVIIVIELVDRGGLFIIVNLVNDYNCDVFVVSGCVIDKYS